MTDTNRGVLDEVELEKLYVRLEKPLYNVVFRWVWDPADAQEIVQEAFLRLWKMRSRVELSTVQPLVYRIALNLAANRNRSHKLWKWLSLEVVRDSSTGSTPEDTASAHQQARAVRAAVERLPKRLREVVMLCEFSNMTYDEIATTLGIAPGTVGSRRHEALGRLRGMLTDWERGDLLLEETT